LAKNLQEMSMRFEEFQAAAEAKAEQVRNEVDITYMYRHYHHLSIGLFHKWFWDPGFFRIDYCLFYDNVVTAAFDEMINICIGEGRRSAPQQTVKSSPSKQLFRLRSRYVYIFVHIYIGIWIYNIDTYSLIKYFLFSVWWLHCVWNNDYMYDTK
jgi:hypothetical protein